MNEIDIEIGKRLQDQARREVTLLQFMIQEADPLTWAKVHQAGLTPNMGDWAKTMDKHRQKRAATKAEAAEIIRRARRFYGSDEECMGFMLHALVDPAWALKNMRDVTGTIVEEGVI